MSVVLQARRGAGRLGVGSVTGADRAVFPGAGRRARWRACWGFGAILGALLSGVPAPAVIFHATDDPVYNTTAPADELEGSGWQWQGRWGNFLGTPVAPRYFLTAAHVGGQVGGVFEFRGMAYVTTAAFDDPNSDLRLWRVCGSFPDFAPLYMQEDEIGKNLVVIGRGTRRGADVMGAVTPLGEELKGWRWGTADGVQRWGENQVTAILDGDGIALPLGEPGNIGDLLVAQFNAGAGPNEAHLSTGDSGGGVFLQDGGLWKLAGISYAVTGPYNTSDSGAGFRAAVFDEGGLYQGGEGNWTFTTDLPADLPGAFYATRISSNLSWINSVLSGPQPQDPPPVLQSASILTGPFADAPDVVLDEESRTLRVPLPATARFYRLRTCSPASLVDIWIEGETLVMEYDAASGD
jgi:hypothetical protein